MTSWETMRPPMKIILTDNRHGIWTSKVSLMAMFDYMLETKQYGQIDITEIESKSEEDIKRLCMDKFQTIPSDMVIFLQKFINLSTLNIPPSIKLNIIIDDIHQKNEDRKCKILEFRKCSRIFAMAYYVFDNFYNRSEINYPRLFPFAHFPNYLATFNPNPIAKILVSGRLNKDIYPFRHLMLEKSRTNKAISYLPVNFAYRIPKDNVSYIYGARYIDHLSKYLVCFTCDSCPQRPYIVKKFFEIPASGSLLLAANTSTKVFFEEMGFIDGIHYISASLCDIDSKIAYVLDPKNRPEIDQIRGRGQELVASRHMHTHRADYLDSVLNSGLKIEKITL